MHSRPVPLRLTMQRYFLPLSQFQNVGGQGFGRLQSRRGIRVFVVDLRHHSLAVLQQRVPHYEAVQLRLDSFESLQFLRNREVISTSLAQHRCIR